MKALMKVAAGVGNVQVCDVEEPSPPPGHVKLEVKAAGICGTDIHIYHDEYRTTPPVIMGHEMAGVVAELGDGVTGFNQGDRVTTETYFHVCGICRYCRGGRPNLCGERRSIGSAVNGAFARYLIVPAHNIHRLPDNISFLEGSLTEPLACVVHGVLDLPRLTPGDLVVVAGPGTIGLLTLQVARSAGAQVVVLGTDADEQRLRIASELGADHAVNVQRQDASDLVMGLTDGIGADLVCECSGAGAAAQHLLALVRKQGQYAQVGLFGTPITWDQDQICYKELSVTGSNASIPSAWPRALRLISRGKVQLKPLVTSTFDIAEWHRAFAAFEQRQGVKIVFQPAQ